MRFVFIFFLFYSSMLFAECNKLYDYDFWNPDVQISDIENELENFDLNVLCGEDDKLIIPLIPASLLSTKANVEFLISKGADVTLASAENIFPESGGTALHAAVMNPFPEHQSDIVYTLIMNGADVNAKREDGRTPFHMVSGITPETVAHLLAAGADIFAKDKDGKIPLDYLCEYGKCENRHFSEGSATAELFKPKE